MMDSENHIKLIDFATAKVYNEDLLPRIPQKRKKKQDHSRKNTAASGQSRVCSYESRHFSFVGTEEYVCPEILNDQESGLPSDIWSLGVIIYQLLSGKTPFKGPTEFVTFENIQNGDYKMAKEVDKVSADLIEALLRVDPDERPTIQELKQHPFFAGVDFSTIRQSHCPYQPSNLIKSPPKLPTPSKQFAFSSNESIVPKKLLFQATACSSDDIKEESGTVEPPFLREDTLHRGRQRSNSFGVKPLD